MPKNGNITGEVFDEGVIKQIDTRQKFLGARYKTDDHLIFQNNQNAFIRLASSVNVGTQLPIPSTQDGEGNTTTDPSDESLEIQKALLAQGENQLKERGINQSYTGMELAKACVLFGGVVGIDDSLNPSRKFGVYNSNEDPIGTIAAYGWGGISKGYAPLPGISDVSVSFYNRGALQKASVKIKVPTIDQLQIFDLLYFRIGYTMLLEWGHNTWIDNDENLQERTEFVTEPFQKFFTEGSSQQDIIKAIKTQRKNDSYNYDAMLGKITNFKWKFNDDGSYDVDLNLIGMGDIIESLKVNKSVVTKGNVPLTPSEALNKKQNKVDAAKSAANRKSENAAAAIDKAKKKLSDEVLEPARKKINSLIDKYVDLGYTRYYRNGVGHMWVNDDIVDAIGNFRDGKADRVTKIADPWPDAAAAENWGKNLRSNRIPKWSFKT